MKILLLDNFDSFTYNLVQVVEKHFSCDLHIVKNNAISLEEIAIFDKIILSPGPGLPSQAGIMPELIQYYFDKKPILGVCLGHQAIAESFGAKLENLGTVFHGVHTETDILLETPLLKNVSSPFKAGRYHSWAVSKNNFPTCLKVTSQSRDGIIMSLEHKNLPIYGVQFHPESVLTLEGEKILQNFIAL